MTNQYRWILVGTLVCFLGGGLLAAGQSLPVSQQSASDARPQQVPDQFRLSVEVELVNVTATVLNQEGKYVEGLTENDFISRFLKTGWNRKSHSSRTISGCPSAWGFLVDTSGSMRHKLQQSLQTARELAQALSDEDEVFIIAFDNNVKVLSTFTQNRPHAQQALRGIRRPR